MSLFLDLRGQLVVVIDGRGGPKGLIDRWTVFSRRQMCWTFMMGNQKRTFSCPESRGSS